MHSVKDGSFQLKNKNSHNLFSLSQKNIFLKPEFPVYMFSYSVSQDPIENLHCHNVLELGVCFKGRGIFIIDNNIYTYEEGSMVFIAPGIYHRAKSSAGREDQWQFLYFDPEDWSCPPYPPDASQMLARREDPELYSLMTILMNEIRLQRKNHVQIVKGLISSVSVLLERSIDDLKRVKYEDSLSPLAGVDERITRVMDLMINAEARQFTIRELSESCYLSESRFRHVFKEQVGISPKHFQSKLKLRTAMNMLRNKKMKIVDISFECGFHSLSSFNRQFKLETGLSPLQWRRRKEYQTLKEKQLQQIYPSPSL